MLEFSQITFLSQTKQILVRYSVQLVKLSHSFPWDETIVTCTGL